MGSVHFTDFIFEINGGKKRDFAISLSCLPLFALLIGYLYHNLHMGLFVKIKGIIILGIIKKQDL